MKQKTVKRQMTVKQFEKLSLTKKRILIAQDVIESLKTKKIYPKPGSYTKISSSLMEKVRFLPVRENFNQLENCPACALGACLLSTTKFRNKLTFNDVDFGGIPVGWSAERGRMKESYSLLAEIFPPEQLLLIEQSFEPYEGGDRIGYDLFDAIFSDDEQREKCRRFSRRYKTDRVRMIAIMKNIIKNNGVFIP